MANKKKSLKIEQIKVSCSSCTLSELCLPHGMDSEELERLDEVVKRQPPLQPGQHLYRAGDTGRSLFAVRSGAVKTYCTTEDGEEQVLGFTLPGELAGLDGMSSGRFESSTRGPSGSGQPDHGRKGRPTVVYGVLTDRGGCPVAVEVYSADPGVPSTLGEQVNSLRKRLGISRVVLVGDWKMLPEAQIEKLREYPRLGWVSPVRRASIRKLVKAEHLPQSLFERQRATEITSDKFPGERLVACFNPRLADQRARKRGDLLAATEDRLQRIVHEVARRTNKPLLKDEIVRNVGKIISRQQVGRCFRIVIDDGLFRWERDETSIQEEALLGGVIAARTSEPKKRLSSADVVRLGEDPGPAEWDSQSLGELGLGGCPRPHSTDRRVQAHLLLGLLASYVEGHMRAALGSLLSEEKELAATSKARGPGARAESSKAAQHKRRCRSTPEDMPPHSFDSLLEELGTLCRNHCRMRADWSGKTFSQDTRPTDLQAHVFQLLGL